MNAVTFLRQTGIVLALWGCMVAWGAHAGVAVKREAITLVADAWCPYNCEPTADRLGLMIELAQKIFARHGIRVDYRVMSWSRAIVETRKGNYQAIVGASRDDAPDFIFPAVEQGLMRNVFYVKRGSRWRYDGLPSLEAISLGVIADYGYSDAVNAYIAKHRTQLKRVQVISGDDPLERNIKKLLAGRVGAVIEAQQVMDYTLKELALNARVVEAGSIPPSDHDRLYIAFSPASPESARYATMMAEGTQAMRASGEFQRIMARYGVEDWQSPRDE